MNTPTISAVPASAMVDQRINISVTGLEAGSLVTLRCCMTEGKYEFDAHAHFIADTYGRLRLTHNPSIGGSFKGTQLGVDFPNRRIFSF